MNIKSTGTIMVLAKNERQGSNRQNYYNLAIMVDGEAGNVSCTEDAYDKAEIAAMNDVVFAYNDQYKSFRILDVIPPLHIPDGGTDTENGASAPVQDAKQNAESDAKQSAKPDAKQEKAAK